VLHIVAHLLKPATTATAAAASQRLAATHDLEEPGHAGVTNHEHASQLACELGLAADVHAVDGDDLVSRLGFAPVVSSQHPTPNALAESVALFPSDARRQPCRRPGRRHRWRCCS
jgi:hypothetical protein